MQSHQQKVQLAREKIQQLLQEEGDNSVKLFVEHHLEEIEDEYWQVHFGTAQPTAEQVIQKLEYLENDDDEDDLDEDEKAYYANHLDFSLPDDVTQYVICVTFKEGEIIDVSMES